MHFSQGQRIDILRFIKFWCISTYTLKTCQSTVKIETTITTKIHPFSNKTTTNSLFTLPRSVPPLSPNYNPDLKLSARKGKYLFTYPPPSCSSPQTTTPLFVYLFGGRLCANAALSFKNWGIIHCFLAISYSRSPNFFSQ